MRALQRLGWVSAVAAIGTSLCFTSIAAKKTPLTKQFTIWGTSYADVTGMEASEYGPYPIILFEVTHAMGIMSHAGRFDLRAVGWLDLNTGIGFDTGVFIAANGDEIPWDGWFEPGILTVVSKPGSTGRFEGGVGGFVARLVDSELDLEAGKLSFTYEGEGEMTF